jgi:hypothetical protein
MGQNNINIGGRAMSKYIDLSKTVAELLKEYPEIKEVLVEAGFKDITNTEIFHEQTECVF